MLTCRCALEAVSSLVLVGFKGPFSYKLYICLVDNGASCVVTLESPCAVVHSICIGRLRWLLSGNRGTIHISCTVAWSQCCDGCWKSFTCRCALEAVSSLILVGFKDPLTYKPYISLVNNGASCVIALEGPSTVLHSICVGRLRWLLSGNSITIFISCTVTWKQRCDTCWKSLTCCCALEAVSSLILVGFKGPFTDEGYISLVDNGASCGIALEGPGAVVHCICVGRLRWLLSGNRGTILICCTVAWKQRGDTCRKSLIYCCALEAISSLILVGFKGPFTYKFYISLVDNGASCGIALEGPGAVVHNICVGRLRWLLS